MLRSEIKFAAGNPSRRRFIAIAGCAAGAALLPGASSASVLLHNWRGVALGAEASIQLAHPDRVAAKQLIDACVAEVRRLERVFSLYDSGSTLMRLNRIGALDAPPFELLELLGQARRFSEITDGAFDVTVQPLWVRYAEHFSQSDADPQGPDVSDVLPLVGWRNIHVELDRVAFALPGMAVTLNGIAQGFITDRIAELLKRNGIEQVLVDLGEIRAVGRHPSGRPWRAGINDPGHPGALAGSLDLAGCALATSGGYGTVFDAAARVGHLIDPRNGQTASVTRSVSVLAGDATTADALSTAFALMDEAGIVAVSPRIPGVQVYVSDGRGLRAVRL